MGADVLASCRDNADAHLQQQQPPCTLLVRQLDWLEPPDWLLPSCGGSTALQPAGDDQFGWRAADVAALRQLSLLLAADCFYDDVLTEACMRR